MEGVEGLEASAIEIERGGPSYTADTVAELQARWPGAELNLIVGADAAAGLDSWERIEEVRSKVVLVVVNRPGTTIDPQRSGRARSRAGTSASSRCLRSRYRAPSCAIGLRRGDL